MTMLNPIQEHPDAAVRICYLLGKRVVTDKNKPTGSYNGVLKILRDEIIDACRVRDSRIAELEAAIRLHRRAAVARFEATSLHNTILYSVLEANRGV